MREMKHLIERTVAMEPSEIISSGSLPEHLRGSSAASSYDQCSLPEQGIDLEEFLTSQRRSLMRQALEMAGRVFDAAGVKDDYLIAGQTNLMGFNELASMERLRRLFDAFTEKHEILHLLDKCMQAEGVQIFIGEESGYQLLDDCSLVTAPYEIDDQVVGVLGVIGPTRMAYGRVIPIVDVTAKLLGAALKPR
mgnify:CR=1 FL=1